MVPRLGPLVFRALSTVAGPGSGDRAVVFVVHPETSSDVVGIVVFFLV
jgi:hypothetical protein